VRGRGWFLNASRAEQQASERAGMHVGSYLTFCIRDFASPYISTDSDIQLKLRARSVTTVVSFNPSMNFVPSYASYPVEFLRRSHKPCLFDLKSD
jgi:hypothetical protein